MERVQKCVLAIIYPNINYTDSLDLSKILKLSNKRLKPCDKLFNDIVTAPSHNLGHLLPEGHIPRYNLRQTWVFVPRRAKTYRFTNTFIPFSVGVYNESWTIFSNKLKDKMLCYNELPRCKERPQTDICCWEWLGRLKHLATGLPYRRQVNFMAHTVWFFFGFYFSSFALGQLGSVLSTHHMWKVLLNTFVFFNLSNCAWAYLIWLSTLQRKNTLQKQIDKQ